MTTPVLLALAQDDTGLLRALNAPGSGVQVVRRCADLPELLGAARAGLGQVAVVDCELDEVDRTVVDWLDRSGVRCLLVAPPGRGGLWAGLGARVVDSGQGTQALVAAVLDLSHGLQPTAGPEVGKEGAAGDLPASPPQAAQAYRQVAPTAATPAEVGATQLLADGQSPADLSPWDSVMGTVPPPPPPPPLESLGQPAAAPDPMPRPAAGSRGRVVVVWGPTGAPGRSTVAANLAQVLARAGEVVLVDADLEAPSLVQALGMPDDSSALASAARLATHGHLDPTSFEALLAPVAPGVSMLSGLGRAGRWRELPPVSMEVVWRVCRQRAAWTVVDVAGGMVSDEVDEYTLEPGPGAVVAELLAGADVVLVVGGADPVGVRRLLQLLGEVESMHLRGRVEVLVNRVRASVVGGDPKGTVRQALQRFGGVSDPLLLPDDGLGADQALLAGRTVVEMAPGSGLGRALVAVAARVDPRARLEEAQPRGRWRLGGRRKRGGARVAARDTPRRRVGQHRR